MVDVSISVWFLGIRSKLLIICLCVLEKGNKVNQFQILCAFVILCFCIFTSY